MAVGGMLIFSVFLCWRRKRRYSARQTGQEKQIEPDREIKQEALMGSVGQLDQVEEFGFYMEEDITWIHTEERID